MPAHTQDGVGWTGQLANELGRGPEGVALALHAEAVAAMVNIRPRIAISSAAITPHFPRCSGHVSNLSTAGAMPHSKPSDTKQPGPSAAYVPSSC
jgi:hypothetical protein